MCVLSVKSGILYTYFWVASFEPNRKQPCLQKVYFPFFPLPTSLPSIIKTDIHTTDGPRIAAFSLLWSFQIINEVILAWKRKIILMDWCQSSFRRPFTPLNDGCKQTRRCFGGRQSGPLRHSTINSNKRHRCSPRVELYEEMRGKWDDLCREIELYRSKQ